MTKIKRIFLDLDDVLNIFAPYALASIGCSIDHTNYVGYPKEAGFDIVYAANLTHPTKNDWTKELFWKSVPRAVWSRAPVSSEFSTILRLAVDAVGKDNVFITTSPIDDPYCDLGKKEWIRRNCPSWLYGQTFIGSHKYCLADRYSLLIDDNEDNANMFRENGGRAILMPRPWNLNRDVPLSTKYLEFYFSTIRQLGVFNDN
jgi:hypothetical protein